MIAVCLIVKQILPSTSGNVKRTVWRICIMTFSQSKSTHPVNLRCIQLENFNPSAPYEHTSRFLLAAIFLFTSFRSLMGYHISFLNLPVAESKDKN